MDGWMNESIDRYNLGFGVVVEHVVVFCFLHLCDEYIIIILSSCCCQPRKSLICLKVSTWLWFVSFVFVLRVYGVTQYTAVVGCSKGSQKVVAVCCCRLFVVSGWCDAMHAHKEWMSEIISKGMIAWFVHSKWYQRNSKQNWYRIHAQQQNNLLW